MYQELGTEASISISYYFIQRNKIPQITFIIFLCSISLSLLLSVSSHPTPKS